MANHLLTLEKDVKSKTRVGKSNNVFYTFNASGGILKIYQGLVVKTISAEAGNKIIVGCNLGEPKVTVMKRPGGEIAGLFWDKGFFLKKLQPTAEEALAIKKHPEKDVVIKTDRLVLVLHYSERERDNSRLLIPGAYWYDRNSLTAHELSETLNQIEGHAARLGASFQELI